MYIIVFKHLNIQTILVFSKHFTTFLYLTQVIKKLPDNEIPGKIYRDDINLIIDLVSVPEETEVLVYDVMGRKLFQRKLSGGTQHILNVKADTKMLLVYLKNSSGNLCRKIIGT